MLYKLIYASLMGLITPQVLQRRTKELLKSIAIIYRQTVRAKFCLPSVRVHSKCYKYKEYQYSLAYFCSVSQSSWQNLAHEQLLICTNI